MSQQFPEIPSEVRAAYFGDQTVELSRLGAGEINATYLARDGGRKSVLQRLSSIFDKTVVDDFDAVTTHLEQDGWEVPRIIPTARGELSVEDERGKVWRLMSFIPSDADEGKGDETNYEQFGMLLGKLHRSLASLNYEPKFRLPHFHDTDYYAQQLADIRSQLPSQDVQLADEILESYKTLPLLPKQKGQLLHGDPKTDNMLFRSGKPFTYIDFDTVMVGSVWLDIGDMLRSLAEGLSAKGHSLKPLTEVLDAYRNATESKTGREQFITNGLVAMRLIALELAMRYMIDIVEDYYFSYDEAAYPTRRASHLARVAEQLRIINAEL